MAQENNIGCVDPDDWIEAETYEAALEAAKDARVRCFKNEANLGFKKNFEKAISLCNGEFIALSDQDDIWLEEKLEISLKAFNRRHSAGKQCDIVCSTALWIDEDEAPLSGRFEKIASLVNHIPNDKKKQFAILILNGFVQGATLLAKASFLKQCLPVSDLCKYHDYWFAQKATLQNGILYIPKPLVLYRRHSSQVTWENRSIYSRGSKEKLQKRISETRENLNNIQASLNLPEEYLRIVQEAAKFNEHQRHRDLFKLAYSFKNCGARYSIRICLEAAFARIKGS